MLTAVETYATGITVNREAIEEAMGRVDPTNPESMQAMALEGIFTPEDTPAAEGRRWPGWRPRWPWSRAGSCHVVDNAAADRLPNVVQLGEAFRRRRAAGGPAEQTFAALVGLELRPRRLREAAALWAALTEHRGIAGRDALWGHPDLLPTDEDFADPEAFARAQLDLDDLDEFDFTQPGGPQGSDRGGGPGRRRSGTARGQEPVLTPRCALRLRQGAESSARVVSQPSTAGSSVARSAGPRSRRQPGVDRHLGRAAARRPGARRRRAVSRSSSDSQSGAGSRAATPNSPRSRSGGRDRDGPAGQRPEQLAEDQAGHVGRVGGDDRGLVVAVGGRRRESGTHGTGRHVVDRHARPGDRVGQGSVAPRWRRWPVPPR